MFRNKVYWFMACQIVISIISAARSDQFMCHDSIQQIDGAIPSTYFEKFKHSTVLDLRNCRIRHIHDSTFHFAYKLTKLDLSNNYLIVLLGFQFNGANNLIEIDLSYNKIELIDPVAFKRLRKLRKINLSHNNIRFLPNGFHLPNVIEINFNNNKLEFLNLDAWMLDHCKIIRANNNVLHSVDIGSISNLDYLSITNNSVTSLNFIQNMTKLSYFDVSQNPLRYNHSRDGDIFKNLFNLKLLSLQSVNLNQFDTAIYYLLPGSLEVLDISLNNLENFDFKSMSQLGNLTKLYMSGNNLWNQNFKELKYLFPNLYLIDINDNNWQCDNLNETINILNRSGITLYNDNVIDLSNMNHIRGVRCEISPSEIQTKWYRIVGILVVILVCLTGFILIIVVKVRNRKLTAACETEISNDETIDFIKAQH